MLITAVVGAFANKLEHRLFLIIGAEVGYELQS